MSSDSSSSSSVSLSDKISKFFYKPKNRKAIPLRPPMDTVPTSNKKDNPIPPPDRTDARWYYPYEPRQPPNQPPPQDQEAQSQAQPEPQTPAEPEHNDEGPDWDNIEAEIQEEEEVSSGSFVPETQTRPARVASDELANVDINLRGQSARQRYQNLQRKKFESTRAIDLRVLDILGIKDDFYRLTTMVGFEKKFWKIRTPAYTELTMEFLCSLDLFHKDGMWKLTFRVAGKKYACNEKQFAEIFGLGNGSIEEEYFEEKLWEELSLEQNRPANDRRSSHIQHPTIRFIQRILSLTIFAKGESGVKLTRGEMAILNQIFHPKGEEKLNLAYFMMRHFERQANNLRAGRGQITLGGYVTHLVSFYDLALDEMQRSGGPNRVSMRQLAEMHIVEQVGNEYRYVLGRHRFPLPFNSPIDLNNKRTWLLVDRDGQLINHAEDELHRQMAEMEASARAAGAGTSREAHTPGTQQEPQWQQQDWQPYGQSSQYQSGFDPAYLDLLQDVHTAQWNINAQIEEEREENRRWRQQQEARNERNDALLQRMAEHLFGPTFPPHDPPPY